MLFHILWRSLTEKGIKYYWALEIFTGIAQRSIKSCNGHSIFTVAFPNRCSPKENLMTNSYSKSHAEKNPISRNKTTISTGHYSWSHLLQFLSQNLHLLRKAIGTGWLCSYSSKSSFLFGVLSFLCFTSFDVGQNLHVRAIHLLGKIFNLPKKRKYR